MVVKVDAGGIKQVLNDFMLALENKKIKLWLEGGSLRYKAPKGAVTQEILKEIGERKEEIIRHLQAEDAKGIFYEPIQREEEKEYYPLSPAQKRMYIMNQMDKESTSYNIVNVLKIDGEFDKNKLFQVFEQLIERHESLRTSFETVDGQPVQKIHKKIDFKPGYMELEGEEGQINGIIEKFIRPYDLSLAPLFRLMLVKLTRPDGTGSFFVLFDMHHIISDGSSAAVIVREFNDLYAGKKLPELKIQYKDYAAWYEKLLSGEVIESQKQYWLEQLQGEIPVLNLQTDYPRPSAFSFKGESVKCRIGRELADKLYYLARENRVTLYTVLISAYYILLSKYTGQSDIVIGTPTAGRRHEDVSGTIGMFINTLALRNYPEPDKTFKEFLTEVGKNVLKAFDNQDYPFEQLVEDLDIQRDMSRNPIFDTMFVLQNIGVDDIKAEGMKSSRYEFKRGIVQNDITINAAENKEGIDIEVHYCTRLFNAPTIQRMGRHFINALEKAAGDPQIKISEIDVLAEEEKRLLIYEFNDTGTAYPEDKTLHRLFEEQVDRTPENIAVTYDKERISYRELDKRANRLANYLTTGHNIRPDSPVGILTDNPLDQVIFILGILKSGGAYVPIDVKLPEERIKTIIDDAGIRIVVSSKEHIRILNRLQWECAELEAYLCPDSEDIYAEEEAEKSGLMDKKLWEYIGENASNEIEGGGWSSSYTGEDFTKAEMEEYAENILKKLKPYLHDKVRVLEIGCASGISMFNIAPHVGLYYGTDLSDTIIEKNGEKVSREGIKNIRLECLAAHEIDRVSEKDFDIVIINSVIQAFHGHNYLRQVIRKAVNLIGDEGILFIGDVMDQELKQELVQSLVEFKLNNPAYRTKTDLSQELFISRGFFEDLLIEMAELKDVHFSNKIHTIENELTKYRYDAIFEIDKMNAGEPVKAKKNKMQLGAGALKNLDDTRIMSGAGPESLAYIIYTSGTTGRPKGVMIEHGTIARTIQWRRDEYKLSGDDNVLQLFNYSFDGFLTSFFTPVLSGACVTLLDSEQSKTPFVIKKQIASQGITHFISVPVLYSAVLDCITPEEAGRLRKVTLAGDKATRNIIDTSKEKLPQVELINEYGPTEGTVVATILRDMRPGKDITIGRPVSDTGIYILDRSGKLQPVGVAGEICISGGRLARGYLNKPELTREKFVPNPFVPGERMYRTGDQGRWLPDGSIEFLGRIDYQVKIRGFRIELGEIEGRLIKHKAVKEAVVIDRQNENGDKNLYAYIVANEKIEVPELKAFLAKELPEYMIPSYFIELERLPLSVNGKVDRRLLPEFDGDVRTGAKYAAPQNATEEKLVGIWRDILGLRKTGINDNFFELGGHSLNATTLVSRIHKEFNVEVPLKEVFNRQTVKEQAQYIKDAEENIYTSIHPVEKKELYPVSSAQKRLYILDQMEGGRTTTYNMPGALTMEGILDKQRLEAAFKALVKRHETLRTSFGLMDGEPVQRIHEGVEFKIDCVETEEDKVKNVVWEFVRPFDLSQAPLMRVVLVNISDNKHLLMFDMHHIIADGVSIGILIKELMSLYNGRKLPDLKIQYKDFTAWQNELLEAKAIKSQEEYWLDAFKGEVPVLNMPVDYTRPSVQSFEGKKMTFEMNEELTRKVKELGAETGTTLYMVLLSAYNILLAKYTGQEDIVVGSPIAGRPHADLENIVGMFVNTLAIRNYPERNKKFIDFLGEVKETLLKAYENQNYQFEQLVEKLDIKRDLSRNPLFDTMLVLQNEDYGELKLPGLRITPYELDSGVSKFNITLNGVEEADKITFCMEYCTKLFKEQTIENISRHFIKILEEMVRNPQVKISDVDMLSEEEKDSVLNAFNNTRSGYPRQTIHRLFEEQVEKTPDRTAVIYGNKQLTYRELNEKSNQLARVLREHGINRNCIVGIMAKRSVEMVIGVIGILKAGGAYLPIEHDYPRERIRYMLDDCGANVLLTQQHPGGKVEFKGQVIDISDERLYNGDNSGLDKVNEPQDLAYVIYTSGTTGTPKGVMVEHKSIANTIQWRKDEYGFNDSDSVLLLTSYSFDPFLTNFFTPVVSGARVVLPSDSQVKDLYAIKELIRTYHITHFSTVPSFYAALLQNMSGEDLKSIKSVALGGEKTSGKTIEESRKKNPGIELINEYGPTENAVVSTIQRNMERESGSRIGKPIANTSVYIINKDFKLQPVGVQGELCLSGEGLARGYLNRPELTKEKFVDNPFKPGERMYRTGDLARWLPDGNIEFSGRIDHQVKIRGFRIELGEIEAELLKHPSIREAIVLDKEEAGGSKYLCAYIVPGKEFTVLELKEFLSEQLPYYMMPAQFVKLERVPMSPNGKIDRKALPEPDGNIDSGVEYAEPVNKTQEELAGAWEEVLGTKNIGINHNFFDIGGDSLRLVRLHARLEEMYPGIFTVSDLFSYATVSKQAEYIEGKGKPDSFAGAKDSGSNFEKEFRSMLGELKSGKLNIADAAAALCREE